MKNRSKIYNNNYYIIANKTNEEKWNSGLNYLQAIAKK
jgi:hypothetical protein